MRFLKLWLPVIVWAAIIVLASNDHLSSGSTAGFFERTFGFPLPEILHIIVRKSGHVFEFSVLALLALRATGSLRGAMLVTFVVACVDETRQHFTTLRTGSPYDVIVDVCGAFLVTVWWMRWRKSKR